LLGCSPVAAVTPAIGPSMRLSHVYGFPLGFLQNRKITDFDFCKFEILDFRFSDFTFSIAPPASS
jgi:hypothetical protein